MTPEENDHLAKFLNPPRRRGKWAGINRARARAVPGVARRSRAEIAWERQLTLMKAAGDVVDFRTDVANLRLAAGCFYRPDFMVLIPRGGGIVIAFDEVKGKKGWSLDDEGKTKWKVAGELYPWLVFRGVIQADRGWKIEEYEPHGRWP